MRIPHATSLSLCLLLLGSACRSSTSPIAQRSLSEARALALSPAGGDRPVDREILRMQERLGHGPTADDWVLLGQAWVQKARASGDSGLYLAAEGASTAALAMAPGHAAALGLRALVLLDQHRSPGPASRRGPCWPAVPRISWRWRRSPTRPWRWGTSPEALRLGPAPPRSEARSRSIRSRCPPPMGDRRRRRGEASLRPGDRGRTWRPGPGAGRMDDRAGRRGLLERGRPRRGVGRRAARRSRWCRSTGRRWCSGGVASWGRETTPVPVVCSSAPTLRSLWSRPDGCWQTPGGTPATAPAPSAREPARPRREGRATR